MDWQWMWYGPALLLVLVGVLGVILPAVPGTPLVFTGMLLAAWADGFERVGMWVLVALGGLSVLSFALDLCATAVGAKRARASTLAIWGAMIGTLVGLFFGILGILLGPFAGAVMGELMARKRLHHTELAPVLRVGVGTWIGIALGIGLKWILIMVMIGIFVWAWVF